MGILRSFTVILLLLFLTMGCGSRKGATNKTLYSKNKPSRVLRKENAKHEKKLERHRKKREDNHRLRTRD